MSILNTKTFKRVAYVLERLQNSDFVEQVLPKPIVQPRLFKHFDGDLVARLSIVAQFDDCKCASARQL